MFETLVNPAMVKLERITMLEEVDDRGHPRQRSLSVEDAGMGDMLRHDAERLRILVERHHQHTGSARARQLLDNWSHSLSKFWKVMPTDYARALGELKGERLRSKAVAAE
jgi:glutamate synthase (NADPH/NADH) large chain